MNTAENANKHNINAFTVVLLNLHRLLLPLLPPPPTAEYFMVTWGNPHSSEITNSIKDRQVCSKTIRYSLQTLTIYTDVSIQSFDLKQYFDVLVKLCKSCRVCHGMCGCIFFDHSMFSTTCLTTW